MYLSRQILKLKLSILINDQEEWVNYFQIHCLRGFNLVFANRNHSFQQSLIGIVHQLNVITLLHVAILLLLTIHPPHFSSGANSSNLGIILVVDSLIIQLGHVNQPKVSFSGVNHSHSPLKYTRIESASANSSATGSKWTLYQNLAILILTAILQSQMSVQTIFVAIDQPWFFRVQPIVNKFFLQPIRHRIRQFFGSQIV